jgi:hypothetical protein
MGMAGMLLWNTNDDVRVIASHRNTSEEAHNILRVDSSHQCKQNVGSNGLEKTMLWIQ